MANTHSTEHVHSSQERKIIGATTFRRVMLELWNRSEDRLSKEELLWFSGACEESIAVLFNLKETINHLACMVSYEGQEEGKNVSGRFQDPDELSNLLFTIANVIDASEGLMEIGNNADCRLIYSKAYQLTDSKQPCKGEKQ